MEFVTYKIAVPKAPVLDAPADMDPEYVKSMEKALADATYVMQIVSLRMVNEGRPSFPSSVNRHVHARIGPILMDGFSPAPQRAKKSPRPKR